MIDRIRDIVPGEGLGDLRFGMTRSEVKNILGGADEVEQHTLDEEAGTTENWHYDKYDLSLSFEEAIEWRLETIAVSNEAYELAGTQVIGLDRTSLENVLKKMGVDDLVFEDDVMEDNMSQQILSSEELVINFWLEDGELSEVQWSVWISEDGEMIHPEDD